MDDERRGAPGARRRLVTRRRREYGEPVDLFEQVAKRWSLTLGTEISPAQVVLCLIDLKVARLARDPRHFDSQADVAGYAAVPAGGEPMSARRVARSTRVKPNKVRDQEFEEVRESDPGGRIVLAPDGRQFDQAAPGRHDHPGHA